MTGHVRTIRLCDDQGFVSDQPVDHVPWPGAESLTYRGLLNNLRAHTGLAPYDGDPFHCTGSAHLAGMHIRCTSPAHDGGWRPIQTGPEDAKPVSIKPCPATVTAVLGFDRPTQVPCGLVAGHIGRHRYEITWEGDGPREPAGTPHPDVDRPYIGDGAPNVRSLRERFGGSR